MFEKMNFRVIIQHKDIVALSVTKKLRNNGFKVYDLRESSIVEDSDESKVQDVYVICCTGRSWKYNKFRKKYKYEEILYEGYKTLV